MFLSARPIDGDITGQNFLLRTLKFTYLETFLDVWIGFFSLQTSFPENGLDEEFQRSSHYYITHSAH